MFWLAIFARVHFHVFLFESRLSRKERSIRNIYQPLSVVSSISIPCKVYYYELNKDLPDPPDNHVCLDVYLFEKGDQRPFVFRRHCHIFILKTHFCVVFFESFFDM